MLLISAVSVSAYDSARAQGKTPPHYCPWIETTKLDPKTLFLWKFSAGDDNRVDVNLDDKEEMIEEDALEPTINGDAEIVEKAGKYGSGLMLKGKGNASGPATLGRLLAGEDGFTVDFWFKPDNMKVNGTILDLPAKNGNSLVKIEISADNNVVVFINGTERMKQPLAKIADGWHFLALTLDGGADKTSLQLIVDDAVVRVSAPAWLKGVASQLGNLFYAGGGKTGQGFTGVIDEVRLSSGVRYFYDWNLGVQELRGDRKEIPMQSPYFKRGAMLAHFGFDDVTTPDPPSTITTDGKGFPALFKPGLKGQALDLSQISKSAFGIKSYNIIPEKNGTIEFWFRPLDWHNFYVGDFMGTDLKYTSLISLAPKGTPIYLAPKSIDMVLGRTWEAANMRKADGSSATPWVPVHPGTWTHVVIVVKNGASTTYLNGAKTIIRHLGLAVRNNDVLKKWRETSGGKDDGNMLLSFIQTPTLIDEFSSYLWDFTDEEVWNAYARWLPDAAKQMKPLPIFKVDYDYFAHSWSMKEKLEIKVACLPVDDVKPASADIEVTNEKGEKLLSVEKQALDDTGNVVFNVNQVLPFGKYPVSVRSRDNEGKILKEEKLSYTREKPAWYGNNLGKERTIPKPWTPVKVTGNQVEVIDRVISIGNGGLPSKIETLKQQVLSSPIIMRVTSTVGTAVLEGKDIKFTETSPDRVAWQSSLAGAGVTADIDAWMEFDGLIYCNVNLKPVAGAEIKLDELDIDFPMNKAAAFQLLANGGGNDFRNSWIARMVPDKQGSVWNSVDKPHQYFTRANGVTNFMPHIWLGGDDVGLYFGAENDRGWTVDGPKPAQEIIRQDDTVIFRMNIIREPVTITGDGRRFHFVILPTPAKPEPPDWRKQMGIGGVNFGACDSFGGFEMKTDPADAAPTDTFRLEPKSWEYAASMATQSKAKWGRNILYADASWPTPGPSFKDWNHDLWAGTGRIAWMPEFEDYAVWAVNEFLRRGMIDGIYWDDVSVGHTYSLASTAYPYEGSENKKRVGFTMLAQRRANMRLWRLFEAAGKEPCIWAHMTVCYEVPLFSFCRYMSNGEFTTGVQYTKPRDAMDFWRTDTLRILGDSKRWGTGVSYLTTLPRTLPMGPAAEQWAYPQRRTEDGLYMTAGIATISGALTEKLKQEKFFDSQLTVYPTWKSDKVLNISAPEGAQIISGVYAADEFAYVFIATRDRELRDVRLDVKIDQLFPGARGVTWRDIDPGLKPPKKVRSTDLELANEDPDPEVEKDKDLYKDEPTEAEQLAALKIRIDGDVVQLIIRPRDYRVLMVSPVR
jgi:hypothetical protein